MKGRVSGLFLLVLLPCVVFGAINFQWNNIVVLGQPNATTSVSTQLTGPSQIALASDSSIWVGDRSGSGRFVQYSTTGLINGAASTSSNINTILPTSFLPDSLRIVGSTLIGSPSASIQIWTAPTTSNNSVVLPSPVGLTWGTLLGIDVAGSLTYASALLENRVLVLSAPNYTLSGIIGQPNNINATSANQPNGVPSNSNLNSPWGIKTDCQGGLWVADRGNKRILRFPSGSATADLVIGQPSFTSNVTGANASVLAGPTAIDFNAACTVMYVADGQRVLRFTSPWVSGMAADGVLGQNSFSTTNGGVGAERFTGITGLDYDDSTGYLWLSDSRNNRVIGGNVLTSNSTSGSSGTTGNAGTTGNTGSTGTTTGGNTSGGSQGTSNGSGTGGTGSGGVSTTGAASRFGGVALYLAKFFY